MKRIDYEIQDRDTVLADLAAAGKSVILDNTTNLVDGVLTDCYCIAEGAPEETETPIAEQEGI
ncbi:MAG TPA: hypothetical protein VN512_13210 [Clostridia bacterium]|nr:hypothetical protein [Clostridia bacterium]